MAVPPAAVWVPIRVSRQSANGKDDNEMIRGAMHRSPGICLTAEENHRKPQLRDRR